MATHLAKLKFALFGSNFNRRAAYDAELSLHDNFENMCTLPILKRRSPATLKLVKNLASLKIHYSSEKNKPLTLKQLNENLTTLEKVNEAIVEWHTYRALVSTREHLIRNYQEGVIKQIIATQEAITCLIDREFDLKKSKFSNLIEYRADYYEYNETLTLLHNFKAFCPKDKLDASKALQLEKILAKCELIENKKPLNKVTVEDVIHDWSSLQLALLALQQYVDEHPTTHNFHMKSFKEKVEEALFNLTDEHANLLEGEKYPNNSNVLGECMVKLNPKYAHLETNFIERNKIINMFINFFKELIKHRNSFEKLEQTTPPMPIIPPLLEKPSKEEKKSVLKSMHAALLMPFINPFIDALTNVDCIDCLFDICTNFY